MPAALPNFYARWRADHLRAWSLNESDIPPERLLQAIWHHQRILRDQLRLLDGRALRVLHPGFWNHGAGPDFPGAVLQFANDSAVSADVEIDLQISGWRGHGHDRNANFRNVALHVVWDTDEANPSVPTLALKDFLDAPIVELALWLTTETAKQFPENLLGQCAAPLRDLSVEQVAQLLNEAALVRLHRKAADLRARARQAGWEQALWEGMLRALGYKQNIWPMQRVGELRARLEGNGELPLIHWQARLLGVSGLLPSELTRAQKSTDTYLRAVWDHWWRERDEFADCALPAGLWRFSGLRPANHPQRRVALAAHWSANRKLVARLETWFTTSQPENLLRESLLEALQTPEDKFWNWHWTLRSARMKQAQPLLGAARVTDLAMNVILPWFWVRAQEGENAALQATAAQRYFAWPAAEDNAVLRLARSRLLGGRPAAKLTSAAAQQGLLQIVRDFCDHSNALCTDCKFPELVRNWQLAAH